ncbi:Competence-induced protein CinA [Moorella glycerini]|uniref:Putative competence-damage inducible protein n=1 Tax=Neomoorella stamsii TaxID=1266720 RepID=A0A9X7J3R5_9FIRM|nr:MULTISPECIES: competence/damage-inducible protein A [Moorella]PRR72344.1 putative competence-damage inducible protein [Moorella stamsii]CEP68845.1 Competence-induced protein CinA [Moorella glycerini]
MLAEAIFTGTEMLLGQIVNTNAAYLGRELAAAGISLYRQVVVGDNLERIREAIDDARRRADLIIVSGGLGPTEDDLSREALAAALNLPLVEDPAALENITRYFAARRRVMTANNLKQALLPAGARALDNPHGTAAGVFLEHEGKIYALLPGPPREFEPMVVDRLLPLLEPHGARREVIFSRVLKIAGMGESAVEEAIKDLLHGDNPTLAPLAAPGEVTLRLTAQAGSAEQARELIRPLETAIRERLGEYIFGSDDDTLEGVVGAILGGRRLTLAIAESCTGGLLAHRVTNIPGSSDYFLGGVVAYSNEAKMKYLGVEEETLAAHGAVSPEVAAAMAQGVRRAFAADIGVGITGIAGPGGATPAKPVGLVYIGVDIQGKVEVQRELFIGERENIKWQSTQAALYLLWRGLQG